MVSTKLEDGSFVTTPVFVGYQKLVEKMKVCDPHEYIATTSIVQDYDNPKWLFMETCKKCGAIRCRHADNKEVLEKYLK